VGRKPHSHKRHAMATRLRVLPRFLLVEPTIFRMGQGFNSQNVASRLLTEDGRFPPSGPQRRYDLRGVGPGSNRLGAEPAWGGAAAAATKMRGARCRE
jgi:hypothetical protein